MTQIFDRTNEWRLRSIVELVRAVVIAVGISSRIMYYYVYSLPPVLQQLL